MAARATDGSVMKDRTIAISGAFGSLGRVVAQAAAERGANVAALDRAANPPAGFAELLGPRALLVEGVDLSSVEGARRAMADVKARFGRLDALVNIAGGFAAKHRGRRRCDLGC